MAGLVSPIINNCCNQHAGKHCRSLFGTLASDRPAIYRQANSYPHLLSESVECVPHQVTVDQLRDRAWAVVQHRSQEARARVIAMYRQLAGTGRTAHDLAEILFAAHQGHIQYLLADCGRELWGTFDPATQEVQVHQRQQPGDEDLVNVAVVHGLAHRGEVYPVESSELPESTPLAAVFRLPLGERSGKRVIREAARR